MNEHAEDMHTLRRQHFREVYHLITDDFHFVYGPYTISLHTDVGGNQWSITTHTKGFAVASKIDTSHTIAHALAVDHLQLIYGFLPAAVRHVIVRGDESPIDVTIQGQGFICAVPRYGTYRVEFFDINGGMYTQESLTLQAPISSHPFRQGFMSLLGWLTRKPRLRHTYTYSSHQRRNSE